MSASRAGLGGCRSSSDSECAMLPPDADADSDMAGGGSRCCRRVCGCLRVSECLSELQHPFYSVCQRLLAGFRGRSQPGSPPKADRCSIYSTPQMLQYQHFDAKLPQISPSHVSSMTVQCY